MFPTFTGNSRRTRNVNLSGQKNTNPFAATAFSPSAAAGASKTVADAQAERRQRQLERDRLKAAQAIQRTWRGHRIRQNVKDSRRREFDTLYSSSPPGALHLRLEQALPTFFAFFDASNVTDLDRFDLLAADLTEAGCRSFTRQRKLLRALVDALGRSAPVIRPRLLGLLRRIVATNPHFLAGMCRSYFEMLARYFQEVPNAKNVELVMKAISPVLVPYALDASQSTRDAKWIASAAHQTPGEQRVLSLEQVMPLEAYEAFASVFLTSAPGLAYHINHLAAHIQMPELASAILVLYADRRVEQLDEEHLLWLLAHFIALQRIKQETHLEALYVQLSRLHTVIRSGLDSSSSSRVTDADAPDSDNQGYLLPAFISEQLLSLVDRNELSLLLSQQNFNSASLLAGYTLVLLRCFPSQAEDIRMRLYLTDVASTEGQIPSVKFFWKAMRGTEAFARIISTPEGALQFLLTRGQSTSSEGSRDPKKLGWDEQWGTILLFLELYIFVLRLTDDEDFRAGLRLGLSGEHGEYAPSRVQQCAMTLDELKSLTIFLKNLAFILQYNAGELLQDRLGRSQSTPQPFNVISGMDFSDFKTLVTTSVRMLYERDSRRTFLPAGHWLMVSKFDMEAFLSAVVLEQEQVEIREAEDGEEDDQEADDVMDVDHQALTLAGHRRSRYALMESLRRRQRQAQRQRTLALIGPKLEVLRNMPYVIPFDTRVQIFRQFVFLDKHRRRSGNIDPDQWRMYMVSQNGGGWNPNFDNIAMRQILGKHSATIKRGQLFMDAFKQFFPLGEGLKEPIQITFVDKFDTEEAGIDGGGVTKEFLISVTREAFSDEHTLFVSNSHNALYPNPYALDQAAETLRAHGYSEESEVWQKHIKNVLDRFEFLGRIVGKCLYEGILIDVAFAGFFLLNWSAAGTDSSGYRANINDLRELDEELYQGMLRLKNYPGDVADLGLDFTISDQVSLPGEPVKTVTRSLVPDGENLPVTNENRPLYISYVARHRLAKQPARQTRAFLRGLTQIINPAWLSMFNQSELQRLVGGDSSEIDVEDLRRHTVYSGLYVIGDDGEEHPTVRLFWQVMHSLRDEERRDVLKYVTSTPRAPLLGFAQLEPKFSIRDGGRDQVRLPSASTCVNLLKLPQYETAEVLRSKLLYAVTSGAGFDLS